MSACVSKGNEDSSFLAVYSCYKKQIVSLSFPSIRKHDAFLMMNLFCIFIDESCPATD